MERKGIGGNMVEPKKVQLMTRLAMMEASETKDALKIVRYSKFDYVRLQLLKTIISITIGLIMILAVYACCQSEYLLNNIASMDYKSIGIKLLMIYILLIIFCMIAGSFAYSKKYTKAKRKIKKYDYMLHELRKYYRRQGRKEVLSEDSQRYE